MSSTIFILIERILKLINYKYLVYTAYIILFIVAMKFFSNIRKSLSLYLKFTSSNIADVINIIKYFLLILMFISLSIYDYLVLDNTLIYDVNSSTGTVYVFVLTTIMPFSIDIAIMQFLRHNIDTSEQSTYLGFSRLKFLYDTYFKIHNFRKNIVFFVILIYFMVYPFFGFNHILLLKSLISNNYKYYSYSLSVWQSISCFIISYLISLIISDFTVSKYINLIADTNNDDKIDKKINKTVRKIILFKFCYDLITLNNTSICYLESLYKCDNLREKHIIFNLSYDIFLNRDTFWTYILEYYYPSNSLNYYLNLLTQYMNFVNDNGNDFDKSNIIDFFYDYLHLVSWLLRRKVSIKQIYSKLKFKDNLNNNSYMVPSFIYHQRGDNNYWESIFKYLFKSNIMSYALAGKYYKKKYCIPLLKFKYNSNGYCTINKKFVQENLEDFIIYYCRYILQSNMSISCIKNKLMIIKNKCPRFFNGFIRSELFKSKFKINSFDSNFSKVIKKYFYKNRRRC